MRVDGRKDIKSVNNSTQRHTLTHTHTHTHADNRTVSFTVIDLNKKVNDKRAIEDKKINLRVHKVYLKKLTNP